MFKKKSFLSYLMYAIGEILLIVIGILLALYLQNKNEQQKVNKTVQVTIKMIKDEIKTNQESIKLVKDYHIMVRDTIKKIDAPKTEKDVEKALGFWRGMNTPRLQNSAFQTSIQSGIGKEVNPKVLKLLNNLYTQQDGYNEFNSQSSQIFFNADFSNIKSFSKIMASVQVAMNDLYYLERGLIQDYNKTLQVIDSTYSNALK